MTESVVVAGMTPDEAWAAVDQAFPLDAASWRDVLGRPPEEREQLVKDMLALGGLPWTKKPGALEVLVASLNVIVTITNPIGAIAGGATSVTNLIGALKAL